MTDIVEGLRAHSNAFNAMSNAEWMGVADAFLEDAAAEIARLRAGGCARDQGTTQYCAEAAKLAAENERLRAGLFNCMQEAANHHRENEARAKIGGSDIAQRKAKAIVARSGVLLHNIKAIARTALEGKR